jgi:two-component system LytT family sensor kinase
MVGEGDSDSIGVGNVDERLRHVFGDEYGLVVETGPGLGTKVSMRVPKFAPGVQA